jgi:hypothetical protein
MIRIKSIKANIGQKGNVKKASKGWLSQNSMCSHNIAEPTPITNK